MNHAEHPTESIVLGGGCFWCLDAVYRRVKGVTEVVSGYAGGDWPSPTYERIETGTTGHAQVVNVTFDSKVITLGDILDIFWVMHDPTTQDRQQYDVGPQYRSIILATSEGQLREARASAKAAQALWPDPLTTEIKLLDKFYPAEDYHQDFYSTGRRPDYCQFIINPKLAKLRQKFTKLLKGNT